MTTPLRERSPLVDPRLRARRRDVRRDEGRRRLRRLQVALGALGAAAGTYGLALSPVLDVDRVEVQGAARTGAAAVEEATGIDSGEAMLTLKLARIAGAVEALPWVDTATVTRRWPGELAVTVTERRPLAVVAANAGSWVVVDGDGRQLVVVDEGAFPELARIVGLDFDPEPGVTMSGDVLGALELIRLLPAGLSEGVGQVTVSDRGIELSLPGQRDNVTLVRFGAPSLLTDKVEALVALADAGVLTGSPEPLEVDVRVPDAPVLTRSGG